MKVIVKKNQLNPLNGIQILRVIATLMVVMVHFGQSLPLPSGLHRFVLLGSYGVEVFFVISGFLISQSLDYTPDVKLFYIKRFFRIVPIYYTVILINMLFAIWIGSYPKDALGLGWLRYFLFLNTSIPSDQHFYWNNCAAVWTISAFIFFYLIAPLVHKICDTSKKYLGIVVMSMILSILYKMCCENIWGGGYISTHSPIAVLYEMLLGAYIYKCISSVEIENTKIKVLLPLICMIIMDKTYGIHNFTMCAIAGIALFLMYDYKIIIKNRLIDMVVRLIDKYSLAIYLGHTTVMFIFSRLQEKFYFSNLILAVLDLIGSFILIIFLHKFVEMKAKNCIVKFSKNRRFRT